MSVNRTDGVGSVGGVTGNATNDTVQFDNSRVSAAATNRLDNARLGGVAGQIDGSSIEAAAAFTNPRGGVGDRVAALRPREDVGPREMALRPREDVGPRTAALRPREDVGPREMALRPREDVGPREIAMRPREDVGGNNGGELA